MNTVHISQEKMQREFMHQLFQDYQITVGQDRVAGGLPEAQGLGEQWLKAVGHGKKETSIAPSQLACEYLGMYRRGLESEWNLGWKGWETE